MRNYLFNPSKTYAWIFNGPYRNFQPLNDNFVKLLKHLVIIYLKRVTNILEYALFSLENFTTKLHNKIFFNEYIS